MNEKERDRMLRIHTRDAGEKAQQSAHYHYYEATSYWMLDELFSAYELNRNGTFVDFGCGKGRIIFYVHHYFHLSVVGVEMNEQLYRQALLNESTYLAAKKRQQQPIRIELAYAERYAIQPDETTFFLFNPFSLKIFDAVVRNMMASMVLFPRTMDLILYYPSEEYIDFLLDETPFRPFQQVDIPGLSHLNKRETFLIFRYEKI